MLTTYEPAQVAEIQQRVGYLHNLGTPELRQEQGAKDTFFQFCDLLNQGVIRAAQRDEQGTWMTNAWVKEGILMGMKLGTVQMLPYTQAMQQFIDKDTLPLRQFDLERSVVRVVPGGTSIRNGVFIGQNVIFMPPSYTNIGAHIGDNTMIDSFALVGSCAQVGANCHISAGALIGGVLEPAKADPCIVEDGVFMGMNTAIAEGVRVLTGAVLGQGVYINPSTPIYDIVNDEIYTPVNGILTVPANAVVIPGSRPIMKSEFARLHGLHVYAPIIIKYKDSSTSAKVALESALREEL